MKRALGLAIAGLVAGGCLSAPPALPAALVVVDTDLPVPRTVTRLRIDIFDERGAWVHSRDYARPRAGDWPVSFGVFSPDDTRIHHALVRLRAYADGDTRAYVGERYREKETYTPAEMPATRADMCAAAPLLEPFVPTTLAQGTKIINELSCGAYSQTGSVAARVEVKQRDQYRFEIVSSTPAALLYVMSTGLSLRTRCDDSTSEIACDIDTVGQGYLGHLTATVDPGTYWLTTSMLNPSQPAQLTLRWAPAARWNEYPPTPPPPAPGARAPLLIVNGADVTPSTEPSPESAIDRLVWLELQPGHQRRAVVTLRGACGTTMSKLALDARGAVDVAASATCVADGVLGPIAAHPMDDERSVPTTAQGTFATEPCAPADSTATAVCVPGGAALLGDALSDGFEAAGFARTTPRRLVALGRFFLDRQELSVARARAAESAGFVFPTFSVAKNDGPLGTMTGQEGTYSSMPMGREDYPLNKISWVGARALCRFFGGDLPTEAQWEYAAVAAGRSVATPYPWGSSPPDCHEIVLGRIKGLDCGALGPQPRSASSADVNALGLVAMGGSQAEWTLDGARPYDDACWRAAPVVGAACLDESAPFRTLRGGSWGNPPGQSLGSQRFLAPQSARFHITGVRCAYDAPPKAP